MFDAHHFHLGSAQEGGISNQIFDILADWEAALNAVEAPVLRDETKPDIQP